jgi:hypothetical protein
MPEHVHVHVPHELSEPGEAVSQRERTFEILAALMMSIATLGIAWSGYQAARWSGEQAELYTEASAARSLANRATVFASQDRLQDLTNFNRWLELSTVGDTELAGLYERRFRDEFRPAFAAWLAQDPMHNPNAIPSPLRMPEYQPAELLESKALELRAERLFKEGKQATENADEYVFITVFFAAVLFFAGMSLRFAWPRLRMLVLVFGAGLLVYGFIAIVSLPVH